MDLVYCRPEIEICTASRGSADFVSLVTLEQIPWECSRLYG